MRQRSASVTLPKGLHYVGAIHGILSTAWSAAGIAGAVLINCIREYNVTHGVPKSRAYNVIVEPDAPGATAPVAAVPGRAQEFVMTIQNTTPHSHLTFWQLLLAFVAHRVSEAAEANKPKHSAEEIAALVARSNNPTGT